MKAGSKLYRGEKFCFHSALTRIYQHFLTFLQELLICSQQMKNTLRKIGLIDSSIPSQSWNTLELVG